MYINRYCLVDSIITKKRLLNDTNTTSKQYGYRRFENAK